MKLSQECIMLQTELKKFSQQVLTDKVDEFEKSCDFPFENVKRLAEMGILGAVIPETYGGAALDTIGLVVVLEELSKVCASTAFIIASHNAFFAYPILKFGTEDLQKKYLLKAATGETIGGYAVPKTGELNVQERNGKRYVNGRNPFVLNAAVKGPFVIGIPEPQSDDSTLYLLEEGTTGCKFTKRSKTIGLRSAGIGEYLFENCCPSPTNIIGQVKQGKQAIQTMQDYARILLGAISLGIAQGAIDAAVKYSKERVQFQQPIINFGMVREQVADMSVNIAAARHLVYDAALRIDQAIDARSAAAMAKLFASQSATAITTAAIQVYGGYGYMKDYPAERFFRDAQMINVICSTPDEDKEIIVKEIT